MKIDWHSRDTKFWFIYTSCILSGILFSDQAWWAASAVLVYLRKWPGETP